MFTPPTNCPMCPNGCGQRQQTILFSLPEKAFDLEKDSWTGGSSSMCLARKTFENRFLETLFDYGSFPEGCDILGEH